ncbi:hypothetical protein V498_10398, partial [Pseudogymnoascus sp. VKM F-4517 (FW-2822)]
EEGGGGAIVGGGGLEGLEDGVEFAFGHDGGGGGVDGNARLEAKMSDKANPSSDSTAASGSTSSKSFTPYTITSSGTNSKGNHHDSRIQPAGPAYHYSNSVSSSCTSDGARGMDGADKCRTGVTTTRTATSRRTTRTGRGVLRTPRPMGMCTRSDGVSGAGVDGHYGGVDGVRVGAFEERPGGEIW